MDLYSYSVAHEIDNPISGIKTSALYLRDFFIRELNLSESQKKEVESSLNAILRDQDRISALIKAVEEFGKPVSAEFGPLRLKEVLKSYLEMYLPQFNHHGILLTQDIPESIPFLRGSKQELMQVLVNLSNNSIHALLGVPQGGQKHIHLKVEAPTDFIRIIFSDNGYGIVREKLNSIFAPFTTTKASTEGKGMGLNTCRRIIERHQGKLWAESEGKGKGASFIIELPIAKDITEADFKKPTKGQRLF
jgi:two-component system sensor histidine kinase DctS